MFSFSLHLCNSLSLTSLGSHSSCSITTLVGITLLLVIYRLRYELTLSFTPCVLSVCVSLALGKPGECLRVSLLGLIGARA